MYQYALVQMLHNNKENKWHPIFYYDSPLPGGFEEGSINNTTIRYKSKGHHTHGFDIRDKAVESAKELEAQLKAQGDTVTVNIDTDIEWDGEDTPTDHVLLPYPPKTA